MMTLIQAIARMEGFGPPANRATRNNNPGNLNFEPWQESVPCRAGDDPGRKDGNRPLRPIPFA